MDCHRSIFCKSYVVFVVLMIILLAGMLVWIANARLDAFHQYHHDISQESALGVQAQVSRLIEDKQRMVELFADEQIDWIRALASNPDNDELRENLGELLTRYFPGRFAFSIADNLGEPRFEDFDGLIGETCLSDLKTFSQGKPTYHPYIHPASEGYHFDVMVRYGKDGREGVFFVAFLVDALGNIISSIQSPDQQIMLIRPQAEDLIEVVAEGARNHWVRDDYRLSVEERARITMRHDIKGTRWQAVAFHNPSLHESYRNKLIVESVSIFLVFITIAVMLVLRLLREERHREYLQEQRQALMGVVSHEFRSPASVIKSALDLVADGDAGEVSDDVKKYIDMASSSTSHLLLLVNDFLDLEKMESESLKFDKQETQLSDLVTDVVTRNTLYANQFSVRYELKESPAKDNVLCDQLRIEQVLINFLSNAAKYGGKDDVIEVAVIRMDKRLRVSVSDHGSGIPKIFQPRVFEKFATGLEPNNTQKKGPKIMSTGLGLSIAKMIIEQHGGTIGFTTKTDSDVDTGSETGTTFWFELPVLLG